MTTTASRPGPSIGDVHASVTRCGLLNADGETCGHPGMPGLPLGVCESHAIQVCRAVMRLGGITVEDRP